MEIGDTVYVVQKQFIRAIKVTFVDSEGIEWHRYPREGKWEYTITEAKLVGRLDVSWIGEVPSEDTDSKLYLIDPETTAEFTIYSSDTDTLVFSTRELAEIFIANQ